LKVLLVTVAGTSSRFSESVGYPCVKCLYSEEGIEESLLYRMVHMRDDFDYYVIVGGFQYEELEAALSSNFQDLGDRLILVKNEHYADYGSGYSLYIGLEKIRHMDLKEVVFAEGDLFVDEESFGKICDCKNDVITCSREPVLAEKSVALYFDMARGVHYIYDTAHGALEINEPFLGIFNSGQIWKFADMSHLWDTFDAIDEKGWQGTNLVLIQRYFGSIGKSDYDTIMFRKWVNCNTVLDYRNRKVDDVEGVTI